MGGKASNEKCTICATGPKRHGLRHSDLSVCLSSESRTRSSKELFDPKVIKFLRVERGVRIYGLLKLFKGDADGIPLWLRQVAVLGHGLESAGSLKVILGFQIIIHDADCLFDLRLGCLERLRQGLSCID